MQLVYETLGEEVANKDDITQVRSEMTKEFVAVRSEMSKEFSAVRSEMATKSDLSEFKAEIRSEISEFKSEILYKLGALMLASTTATTAIIGILIKF